MMQTKTCKCCGEVKPVEGFYRHPAMSDGRLNQCKECKKVYQKVYGKSPAGKATSKRTYQKHKSKIRLQQKQYAQQNRETIRERSKEYYKQNKNKIRAYHKQWYSDNREEVSERTLEYQKTPKGKEVRQRAERRYKKKYPEKTKAHRAVSNAIRGGKLVRGTCEICGDVAEAHHEDYSRPFDIRWLCFVHHREIGHDQVVMRGATSCV